MTLGIGSANGCSAAAYMAASGREPPSNDARLAAKSRGNPSCPKADFQWRGRLDPDTRALLNERVDRQSNGSRLRIYAGRIAESQALLS
jgi:hypothetical protein